MWIFDIIESPINDFLWSILEKKSSTFKGSNSWYSLNKWNKNSWSLYWKSLQFWWGVNKIKKTWYWKNFPNYTPPMKFFDVNKLNKKIWDFKF